RAQATVRVNLKGTWRPGYITVSGTKGGTACHVRNHDHPWGRPWGLPQGWSKPQCPFANATMTRTSIKRILT
ncbi:MAG: hypothetical protein ACLPT6_02270, partial [Desulfobaccales bacterium]